DGVPEVKRLDVEGELARVQRIEEQDAFNEVEEFVGVDLNTFQSVALFWRHGLAEFVGENGTIADDGTERGAQLVGEVRQEVLLHMPAPEAGAPARDGAAYQIGDLRDIEGFGDVVKYTMPQPANGRVERTVTRNDDDFDIWVEFFDPLHHLDPRHRWHP